MDVIFPDELYFSGKGRELIKSLIGQKIIRMFHYYIGNDQEELQNDSQILRSYVSRDQFFSIIEGALLVEFDSGIEISFGADESMSSINFVLNRNNNSEYMNLGNFFTPLDQQQGKPFIDVNDTEFSNEHMRNFLFKKITDIKLYRKDGLMSSYRIKDSALVFLFEDSQQMIIGYNLLKIPSVLTVTTWDLIPSEVQDNLFEVPEILHFSIDGKELMKSLIGQKIVRMFRYYSDNQEEDESFLQKFNIQHEQFFSTIDGELLVEFDSGMEVSFFNNSPMNSIGFWLERNDKGVYMDKGMSYKPLDKQDKLFIDVNGAKFSSEQMRNFLYKKITNIKLYRKNEWTKSHCINDSIISFVFEDSQQMLIGLNVLRFPSIMSVSTWDLIPAEVCDNLFEVPML
jgi:hypothetical protein